MSPRRATRSPHVPAPRYIGVEDVLRQRIAVGTYKVGHSLPSESDLAQEFEVSRFTIREALRRLSEAGLISRQQGARSRVRQTEPMALYTFTAGSAEDLSRYASNTYFDIRSTTSMEAGASLARFLRCRETKEWLRLRGVRRDAETTQVVGFTEVYLWAEFKPHLRSITVRGQPIYLEIEERLGIHAWQIRQEISAISMPEDAAMLLGTEPGSPALEIVRRYFSFPGRAFEVARNLHVAGSFVCTQDFRRQERSAADDAPRAGGKQ